MTEQKAPILPGPGDSDYERYLRTDELLSLQTPPEEAVHRDELLFQTVHQSSELWLKLGVSDALEAARLIDLDTAPEAARLLRRSMSCLTYVISFLDMLDQLDPWDYHHIRMVLGHGSGFDSPGFRDMSRALPAVGGAFDGFLGRRGVTDLVDVYRNRADHPVEYELAELLTDLDEHVRVWRVRHYTVVVRALGEDTIGIQGTPIQVLPKLIAQRQLPKLWEARSRLTRLFDAEYRAEGAPE